MTLNEGATMTNQAMNAIDWSWIKRVTILISAESLLITYFIITYMEIHVATITGIMW